jgi:hypothetical protein
MTQKNSHDATAYNNAKSGKAGNARAKAWEEMVRLCAAWEAVSKPPPPAPAVVPIFPPDYNRANLSQVCRTGDLPALQILLAKGADIHAVHDYALRGAAENGQTEIVRLLLERGADIHARNDVILSLAAGNGHFATMDLLVERGAPMEKLKAEDRRAYDLYRQEKERQQLAALQKTIPVAQSLRDMFTAAVWAGHVPEMKKLWSQIPKALQAEFDFSRVLAETKAQTQRQRKPNIKLVK